MNKTLWKLQIIGERLWMLANTTAQQAATLEMEGRGLAVVSNETRKLAQKVYEMVERALFEDREIKPGNMRDVAMMLNLLALNSAIESHHIGWRGKPAAVCADDIRCLAYELAMLFDNSEPKRCDGITPIPKDRITSADNCNEFLLLNVAGVTVVERLANIKEVCMLNECTETHIKLRGMEIPLIDGHKLIGKPKGESAFIILQTPWAEQNKTYAVAANVMCIFCSPIGKPVDAPTDMPLAKYVREYWESENSEPFYFMDWPKMI